MSREPLASCLIPPSCSVTTPIWTRNEGQKHPTKIKTGGGVREGKGLCGISPARERVVPLSAGGRGIRSDVFCNCTAPTLLGSSGLLAHPSSPPIPLHENATALSPIASAPISTPTSATSLDSNFLQTHSALPLSRFSRLLPAHNLSPKSSDAEQRSLSHHNDEKNKASPNSDTDTMFINIPVRARGTKVRSEGHVLSQHHQQHGFPDIPEKRRNGHLRSHAQHHKSIPPAVAALLAVTAIPPPQSTNHNGKRRKAPFDIYVVPPTPIDGGSSSLTFDALLGLDDRGEESGLIFAPISTPESTSISRSTSLTALETLLSPPAEFDENCCSLSVRSASSDSVPSLDNSDTASISSDEPYPPKPRARRASGPRKIRDRRLKIITTTPEDCLLDHPLLFGSESEMDSPSMTMGLRPEDTAKQPLGQVSSFKSNLTASLRALKSAAKSISAFSVPLIQPDDFLTRNILSNRIPFTDEKRPRPTNEAPTPALRRYLNPTCANKETQCTGAIQMQTYNRTGGTRPKMSGRQKSAQQRQVVYRSDDADAQRPREIRENGDFLRVIVLEMNMRREGKLSDTAQGRARVFLPPRKACRKTRMVGDLAGRWEILTAQTSE